MADLSDRCLAFNDVHHLGAFALGCPAFDVFFHLDIHGDFLNAHLSSFSLGQYTFNYHTEAAHYLLAYKIVAL